MAKVVFNLLKQKKAVMSISITLLTLAILGLAIYAIFLFNSQQIKIDNQISSSQNIEQASVNQVFIDFYLNDACSRVTSKESPVSDFKNQMDKFRNSSGKYIFDPLALVDSLIDDKHITLNQNILKINFPLRLQTNFLEFNKQNVNSLDIVYSDHTFTCERTI